MANYLTTDTDLTAVANAIRTKGGTSAPLSFPDGYVQAIGDIETGSDLTALSLPSMPFAYTFNGQYTVVSQGATHQPNARTFPYLETPVYGETYKYVVAYGDSPSYYNQIERTFVYNGPQVFTYSSGAQLTVGAAGLTLERTTAFNWTAVILLKDAGVEGYSSVSARGVTYTNLAAENIKKGVTVSVGDTNMANRIISVAGTYEDSGGGASKKQINFIDYDGTIVQSYTSAEWANVSALPDNPSHTGLVAQGWNWTKAQIDAQLTASPDGDIWVGQMYITESGDTEIDVNLSDSARLSPILTICVNGSVTVDWGDNTSPNTVTGSSLYTRKAVPHTYASEGNYTIAIHVVSGSFQFYCSSAYLILRKNTAVLENRVYANCVENVRFGNGVTSIGNYAFCFCYSLKNITIPNGVTSFGTYVFQNCYSLASVTIPNGVTLVAANTFDSCYTLASVTLPNSVTTIGNSAFTSCYGLTSITIPSSVTSIEGSAFQSCFALKSIAIPNSVTSIGNSAFRNCYALTSITLPSSVTSIGNSAFHSCYALTSITIPSSVTSIEGSAFYNCYGMAEYHILPTNVPTLGTTVFNNIVSDCKIYVPSGTLSDYQSATNWSTYASYMVEESAA